MSGLRLPLSQEDISQLEEAVAEQFQKAATDQVITDVMRSSVRGLQKPKLA